MFPTLPFAVYKPSGISSYDVIRRLKKKFPGEKIGHGGTLDPFAEGVLVIGVGRSATKQLGFFLNHSRKTYRATLRLGAVSTTDDTEGRVIMCCGALFPTYERVCGVVANFQGDSVQTPPRFSALKINGERAYDLARRGHMVVMQPRTVHIEEISVIAYREPELTIDVVCGSGTYIRALARDIGAVLGTGAYLTALQRTRVTVTEPVSYDFTLADTRSVD